MELQNYRSGRCSEALRSEAVEGYLALSAQHRYIVLRQHGRTAWQLRCARDRAVQLSRMCGATVDHQASQRSVAISFDVPMECGIWIPRSTCRLFTRAAHEHTSHALRGKQHLIRTVRWQRKSLVAPVVSLARRLEYSGACKRQSSQDVYGLQQCRCVW
jgi:hypothetical protein